MLLNPSTGVGQHQHQLFQLQVWKQSKAITRQDSLGEARSGTTEDTQSWQKELFPCSADLNQCPGSRGGGKGSSGKSTSATDTARASCLTSTHFKPPPHPEGWAGSSGQGTKTRRKWSFTSSAALGTTCFNKEKLLKTSENSRFRFQSWK